MKRNEFIKSLALGAAGALTLNHMDVKGKELVRGKKQLSFGIISDLHQDFTFDAPMRLKAFVDNMNSKEPDFILQLGDFCVPKTKNKVIMDIWNQFEGNSYHVIGNHEFDEKCSLGQVVDFFQMPNAYHSFDVNGYHIIVLDGNGKDPRNPDLRYPSYFNDDQLKWLENDINATGLPCIVFCHQGLDHNGVINREAVRILFDTCNKKAGYNKVKLVFSGHHHLDYHNEINGIHYIQVNSATYRWLGNSYNNTSFSGELYEKYPLIRYMGYYEDPLWAYVEIDDKGIVTVEEKRSSWKGLSPYDMGMKRLAWDYPSMTQISGRTIQL